LGDKILGPDSEFSLAGEEKEMGLSFNADPKVKAKPYAKHSSSTMHGSSLSPVWRIDEAPNDGKRLDYVHWEGGRELMGPAWRKRPD